jgi:hypothetical protein
MNGTITDTSYRVVRQLVVVLHEQTTPGAYPWMSEIFFDGTNADASSLVNYHFDPFNQFRFRIVSDRTFTLNSRKQADLSDAK